MLRLLKILLWVGCLATGIQSVRAFSPAGPIANGGDGWQSQTIGYGIGGDINAPKNIGEEYRWNTPVLYYAYDQNFLDYFGSNGVVAVDSAMALLTKTFTNNPTGFTNGLDGYSSDLSEIPLETKEMNFTAQALGLLDLKSLTMALMVEDLGLTEPDRYVWTLRARLPGQHCPDTVQYLVIQRNFDPVTFSPSSYVNGTLYTYIIGEACTGPNPIALAEPIPVDPLADTITAVADLTLPIGQYFSGLTRDDVGGLRYLLRTNNLNIEGTPAGSTVFTLVTNDITQLTTLNLADFILAQQTNSPAALLALYPNLDITGVSSNLVLVNITNIVGLVFTNLPWLPAGFPSQILVQQQVVQQFALRYTYAFDNVVTNHFYTNLTTLLQVITITPAAFGSGGSGVNTSTKTTKVFGPGGDFYILPPGVVGYVFTGLVITNVTAITNVGNAFVINNNKVVVDQTVTFFTNYTFVVRPIVLQASTTTSDLYQGIEKITYVRRDFDSLFSQTWIPITNSYNLRSVSGNSLVPHVVRRVVTAPDILFTAADIPPTTVGTLSPFDSSRNINFNQANILSGLAGPGTIEPQTTITFNTEAPVYYNAFPFLTQPALPDLVYGSFDGTTNTPVIYPDGTSIQNIENQVLMQITSTTLPMGTNGVPYNGGGFQLTGSGGSPPYSWDIINHALPPGLTLSSDGLISGVPTSPATYDFTVRMTDIGSRSVQQDFSITIHP